MQISDAQMQAFQAANENRFDIDMAVQLSNRHPDTAKRISDAELRMFVRAQRVRAGNSGIDRRLDIERFIDLMFRISDAGSKTDHEAWLGSILSDESLVPRTKLDRIESNALLSGLLRED